MLNKIEDYVIQNYGFKAAITILVFKITEKFAKSSKKLLTFKQKRAIIKE